MSDQWHVKLDYFLTNESVIMSKQETTRIELLMDAGNGAQKAGDIFVKCLAKVGYEVFIEPIIPAEISPPKRTPYSLSGVIIRVGGHDITNIGASSDFMLVEHEILLKRRLEDEEYGADCQVVLDMGQSARAKVAYDEVIASVENKDLNLCQLVVPEEAQAMMKSLGGRGLNMLYLGVLGGLFQVDVSLVESETRKTFSRLSDDILAQNLQLISLGYALFETLGLSTLNLSPSEPVKDAVLLDGNMAMSLGIIDAGFKLYSGYPITPASSILHTLAKLFPSYGGVVHQAEDEISAIGTVIGSYYTGVPALTATSGPGLSLKQEFIGLSQVSEVPCVVINVQRGGPSTGLPTRTEQSDLFASIYGSHGDATKVVISVGDVKDCFYAPHVARYLTEVLQVPVIILSDYITSVSYKVLQELSINQMTEVSDIRDDVLAHFGLQRLSDDIEMVKDKQSLPGEPGKMRRVTGLNTDSSGKVVYSAQSNMRSHQVRNEKVHQVRRALNKPELIGPDQGDVLVVAWGSSRGVVQEAIQSLRQDGHSVSGLSLKMVYPLSNHLADIFKQFKKVVTVETAYGDEMKNTPFATMLRSETLVDVKGLVNDATGRPLNPSHVVSAVKGVMGS